ncbi:MAG: hypothetical protein AAFO63_04995 [Pseudomonadota bacterium]
MKSIVTSAIAIGGLALPSYAHNDPVPHAHGLPLWGLAMIGLAAGAFGTWATMKCLAYVKENRDG